MGGVRAVGLTRHQQLPDTKSGLLPIAAFQGGCILVCGALADMEFSGSGRVPGDIGKCRAECLTAAAAIGRRCQARGLNGTTAIHRLRGANGLVVKQDKEELLSNNEPSEAHLL